MFFVLLGKIAHLKVTLQTKTFENKRAKLNIGTSAFVLLASSIFFIHSLKALTSYVNQKESLIQGLLLRRLRRDTFQRIVSKAYTLLS